MHVGVLGMRWGSRRGPRSAHQKKIDQQKITILRDRLDSVKDKKVLNSKAMKRRMAEIEKQKFDRQKRLVMGSVLMGIGIYNVANNPLVKYGLYNYAKKVNDARGYVKVSPNVIDVNFK